MTRHVTVQTSADKLSKNVQPCPDSAQAIPPEAVLAGILKTLEEQLQSKGLVHEIEHGTFNPLWFLAETEKNIFLWRHGRSLVEQDEFEFWIDVEALIKKRLHQLETMDPDNPFMNPLWEISLPDPDIKRREKEYLNSFLESFRRIHSHANALSQVASQLDKEYRKELERELVVLPAGSAPSRA